MTPARTAIIGGGPAGTAAAIALARAGRDVVLIERQAEPTHRVCGDFLSAEAVRSIAALGIDLMPLDPAPISAMRLVHGRTIATAQLPFPAFGLTRRTLDSALLDHASRTGAHILRGQRVRSLDASGTRLRLEPNLDAGTVLLATGKHELRGVERPATGSGLVGLKAYFNLARPQAAALRRHVEIVLYPGGYAGLLQVEQGAATLCLLIEEQRLAHAGGPAALLAHLQSECPHLADRLRDAQPLDDRIWAVAGMPYGWVHAPGPADHPRLFRLGDQAGVIPSITGAGVAIALYSGMLAARAVLDGADGDAFHARLRRQIGPQVRLAKWVQHACAPAWAQPLITRACAAIPALIRVLAARTRIPDPAL